MHFWMDDGPQEGGVLVVLLLHNGLHRTQSPLTTLGVSACVQPDTCG